MSVPLVEQHLLEPNQQLKYYRSMGWPNGMSEIVQDKPWPLFPSWSDALIFLTDKGRAAIAEYAAPEAMCENKPGNPYQKKNIKARMLETMLANPECRGWPCAEWAKHLKCSRPSVVDTDAWKELERVRDTQKAEKAMDRHRRAKR